MTVFVPQYNRQTEKRKDITDLERYGEVRVVAWRYPFPDDEAPAREPMQLLAAALTDYNPITDWVALVGSYVHIAAAMFILGQQRTNPIRLLVYDREMGGYYPVVLNIGDTDAIRHESGHQGHHLRDATEVSSR